MTPQMHGELSRSKAVRGVTETIIFSKKYLVPLAIVSHWVLAGGVAVYLADGMFNPEKHVSTVLKPVELSEYLSAFSESPELSEPPDEYDASTAANDPNDH